MWDRTRRRRGTPATPAEDWTLSAGGGDARPIDGFPRAAARTLAAGLVLAACADAPTGSAVYTPGPAAAALLSRTPADEPVLVFNAVKYRDAGYRPATGRAGSATLSVRALLGADGTTEVEAPSAFTRLGVRGWRRSG